MIPGGKTVHTQGLIGLVITIVGLSFWITNSAGFELHFDEAQYWTWSQQLDWSYYSKGPLVAWLIAASTTLFGQGEWQIRLPAWLAHGLFLVLIFFFTRTVFKNTRAAWWAVVLILTTPVYFTLGLVMTTDIFLFVFWTWGLWAAYRALFENQPSAWYEVGTAIGIGALTKLSIGLLPFFIGLITLINPNLRRHLLTPQLWFALILMLLWMSPLIGWNAQNDWVMFRHEMGHVEHQAWSINRVGTFLIGQWAALSPLVVLLLATFLWKPPSPPSQLFLWWVTAGSLIFFISKAGSGEVYVNWAAACYIGLFVLLAGRMVCAPKWAKIVLWAGMTLSVVMMAMLYFPYQWGFSTKQDPFKTLKVWRQPILEMAAIDKNIDFILTPNYKLASELAFYWPEPIPVYLTTTSRNRRNQFDLWPDIKREAGNTALYISNHAGLPPIMEKAFTRCTPLKSIDAIAKDGTLSLRSFHISRCEDYQAIQWPQLTNY